MTQRMVIFYRFFNIAPMGIMSLITAEQLFMLE